MVDTESFVIIRSHGNIFRIKKEPFETEEQAGNRAWYIVKRVVEDKEPYDNAYIKSLSWVYRKYLGVSYT